MHLSTLVEKTTKLFPLCAHCKQLCQNAWIRGAFVESTMLITCIYIFSHRYGGATSVFKNWKYLWKGESSNPFIPAFLTACHRPELCWCLLVSETSHRFKAEVLQCLWVILQTWNVTEGKFYTCDYYIRLLLILNICFLTTFLPFSGDCYSR